MKRIILTIGIMMTISGCTNFPALQSGLTRLHGKPLDTAIRYFGYPDNAYRLEGRNVYVWGVSQTYTRNMPVTINHSGTISGSEGYASYSGTSTGYIPRTVSTSCTIKIKTDDYGIIDSTGYDGSSSGCSGYAHTMRQYMQDSEAGQQ